MILTGGGGGNIYADLRWEGRKVNRALSIVRTVNWVYREAALYVGDFSKA